MFAFSACVIHNHRQEMDEDNGHIPNGHSCCSFHCCFIPTLDMLFSPLFLN